MTEGGDRGPERSDVGSFGHPVRGHVRGDGENGVVTGTSQTKEDTLHLGLDGVGEGPPV